MHWGFGVLDRPSVREQIRLASLAERHGFSSIWVCETRLARDAISVMGALAATTSSIRIGSGVVNTWNRNPALMAMTFATLNNLAPGRIMLGLGTYWDPLAAKQGITRRRVLTQMREYIEVTRRLLSLDDHVTFTSDLITVEDLRLDLGHGDPRTPQEVPIYVGATGPRMMALAGEVADGVLINGLLSPEYVADSVDRVRTGAAKAGRDPQAIRLPAYINVALDEDSRVARDTARRLVAMYLGQQPHIGKASGLPQEYLERIRHTVGGWPTTDEALTAAAALVTDDIALRYAVAGTATECRQQLQKWYASGLDEIVVVPLTENYEAMIQAFGPTPVT